MDVRVEGVLTCYLDYGHSGVSFLSLSWVELKPVFSDNLISSVNTHPTDARFHGINEAASCADACERRAPFKLLSFIASPPFVLPPPEITLAKPISFTTCHFLIQPPAPTL